MISRERWMALFFALGSTCFLIGPFPGYLNLVGAKADGITFFVGSILFTAGGALQSRLAFPARRSPGAGRAAWWAAILMVGVARQQGTGITLPAADRGATATQIHAIGATAVPSTARGSLWR